MAHHPIQLTADLYAYYQKIGYREPPLLKDLRLHFQDHPQHHQHTLPETAQCLAFLVQLTQPQHILEIGTFIGYSTLAMALAMPGSCRLTTCDKETALWPTIEPFLERSGRHKDVTFHPGAAEETLSSLLHTGASADLIYIDANKKGYDLYYEQALRLTPSGGVILLDNTLSAGQVIAESAPSYVTAIKALNQKIHADPRVDMLLLPFGDGLTLLLKRPSP